MTADLNRDLKVQIYGKNELIELIKHNHKVSTHLISIGNPKSSIMQKENIFLPTIFRIRFKSIIRFSFFDVEEKKDLGSSYLIKRIPQKKDVKRMIRYFYKTKDKADGYIFHCTQGVSRSAAMALGVLYLLYKDEKKAADKLLEIRPLAKPHRKIILFFDQELGSNLTLQNIRIHSSYDERMNKLFYEKQ